MPVYQLQLLHPTPRRSLENYFQSSSRATCDYAYCLFPLVTESMTRPCRHHVPDALLSQRAQLLFCCGIFIP